MEMDPAAASGGGLGSVNSWGWAVSMVWLVMGGGMWVMLMRRRKWRVGQKSAAAAAKDPWNWPLVGMLPSLVANLGSGYYDWMTEVLVANGGTFQFKGPWLWLVGGSRRQDALVTADPRNIEYVLRHNFPNYPKGPDFTAIFHDLLGDGIFNADHDLWRMQRKTASLHLNSRACREFADLTLFESAPKKLLPILRRLSAAAASVDFQDLMLRFTFDTISIVAFGEDTGCLTPDLPMVPFARAFETALEATSFRFSTPPSFWKLLRFFRVGWERKIPSALHQIDAYVQGVVDRRRAAAASGGSDNDLISCFIRVQDEDAKDDKFLKDVIVNMLLAGRDTSALALSWFFWLLATHPDVEEKLVQEAREVLLPPPRRGGGAVPSPPTDDDDMDDGEVLHSREKLNRLVYLQAALSEALRLYPSVPTDFKYVMTDDTLPDGSKVLRGQRFIYSIYSMGRMESIWGADCRSFRPERWLLPGDVGGRQLANISPFQYTAFNAGPRTCLGKDMAYTLMKVVASAILLRYHVALSPDQPKIVPKISPTLYMKNGMLVTFQRRRRQTTATSPPPPPPPVQS